LYLNSESEGEPKIKKREVITVTEGKREQKIRLALGGTVGCVCQETPASEKAFRGHLEMAVPGVSKGGPQRGAKKGRRWNVRRPGKGLGRREKGQLSL